MRLTSSIVLLAGLGACATPGRLGHGTSLSFFITSAGPGKGADLGADGDELVIDFNYAYHPSCVYDPVWSCPLAPPENRLTVPIHAGERLAPVT